MGDGEGVHASRDGDRYHYYWAARRALRLLDPVGDLTVVGVEGLPEDEIVDGDEVIDVAEYYGGGDAITCTRLRYAQLKHSTLRVDVPITASELTKTLKKFAVIYRTAVDKGIAEKYEFVFVANRVLNDKVRVSLAELADGAENFSYSTEARYLRRCMAFDEQLGEEADFCRRFRVEDGGPGVAEMERILREELRQFLPGGGTGSEMAQLMERVSRCATTLVEDHTLDRGDVLLALRTTVEQLFPAPNRFEQVVHRIDTEDIDRVVEELVVGPTSKVLITAIGGVGKSVLATTLAQRMPAGSVTVVYDCFAGGDYRRASSPRHGHRIGLTQIVNELAGQGWCTPLIPTEASTALYMQVFMRRINSVAEQLAARTPDALLTIVIDAADNAVMAAQPPYDRTFVTDLFREDWPSNSRVVQLCRPERKSLLEISTDEVMERTLRGFSRSESLLHLRSLFPDATEADGAELYALSGGNPRVQAMAMQNAESVRDTLAAIAFGRDCAPGTILDTLLDAQIRQIAEHGHMTDEERRKLCTALATLPPPIPLPDLSQVSGVHADAIRSFAVDLGRGIQIAGDTLQFRDEPTETWFRNDYSLTSTAKREFVESILPLARTSPYVARALPQLMFEAAMLGELVELTLSQDALPGEDDAPERQEIARSRTKFALCAMLQTGHHAHAALLAVKAGAMSSGHARLMKLYRTHTDLTARFLDAATIEDLCASQELAVGWPGSNLYVEAALLSHIDRLKDTARSRLRSATSNFAAILRMPDDDGPDLSRHITENEIADLAMTATNIDSGIGGLAYLSRWRPNSLVYRVALKLSRRLADAGRDDDLKRLVVSDQPHKQVQLAVAKTLFEYNIAPGMEVLASGIAMLRARNKPFKALHERWTDERDVSGIVWLVVHGVRQGCVDSVEAVRILDIHLPQCLPTGIASRSQGNLPTGLLLGYALRARLLDCPLDVTDLVNEKLRTELRNSHSSDRILHEFRANIPPLLPWINCWLAALLDYDTDKISDTAAELISSGLKQVTDYNTPYVLLNSVAETATCILSLAPRTDLIQRFTVWHTAASRALGRSRIRVARIAVRSPELEIFGLEVVTRGVEVIQRDRTESESRIEDLIRLGRTVLATHEDEAHAIFENAVAEAASVGDELFARWQSLVTAAKALAGGDEPARAYRLFQIAETLESGHLQLYTAELAQRLHDMHSQTYFAAISRARDRRTFSLEQTVPPAFKHATTTRGHVGLLALYSFEPEVSWQRIVTALDPSLRTTAADVFTQFTRYERHPDDALKSDELSGHSSADSDQGDSTDLSILLSSCDFTTVDGWVYALAKIPWYRDRHRALAMFALDRHPTKVAGVLDALTRTPTATMDSYVSLAVESAARLQTPALKAAINRMCASMASRFARSICVGSYNDERIAAFTQATGISDVELTRMAMHEIGRDAHHLDYGEYFYLAGQLANILPSTEAGAVFDTLASLFDDLASPVDSSDGCYTKLPTPPNDTASCLAGLVWAVLGDVAVHMRWRAAHAVLLLTQLNCIDELAALARFARGTQATTPFVDTRFPFYALHARTWLLLALSRAATEPNNASLACFGEWLIEVADGPHHAANQQLAQRTLTRLTAAGVITLPGSTSDVLTRRLTPAVVDTDDGERGDRANPLLPHPDNDEGSYRFFFDFESDWCRPLAKAFASTEADVARRAFDIAARLDGHEFFASDHDPRATAGVYNDRTHVHHSEWPAEERHSFYMGVHALLTLGAELAQTTPTYQDPWSPTDAYTEWLADFLPTRDDGRWLSDRRDPPPYPAPDRLLSDPVLKDTWPWSLTKDDFQTLAGFGSEWITVSATIDSALDDRTEGATVESCFVPSETARSLLIALQTIKSANSMFAIRIPTIDDQHERPDNPPYQLTPWLNTETREGGIDRHDQRRATIRFPPTRPATDIITRFELVSDKDLSTWFHQGKPVFRSRVWSNMYSNASNQRETGTRGNQLEVDPHFLQKVLRDLDTSLILRVGIRRDEDSNSTRLREKDDDDIGYIEWSAKIYVIDPSGHWLEY